MERKLASVQVITELNPIEGKDRIVLASILGWRVIAQKSQFNVGDKCVYVEPDTILPNEGDFAFLGGKRIRTMKMAGVYSEGIAFPLSVLPDGDYHVGDDVSAIIGAVKYDEYGDEGNSTISPNEKKKGRWPNWLMRFGWFRNIVLPKKSDAFPRFIPKTDEIRIQTSPELLRYKAPMIVTEKLDGCSCTVILTRKRFGPFKRDDFWVCSRNRRIVENDGSCYWKVVDKYNLKFELRALMDVLEKHSKVDYVAFQGEIIGPKIQGNPYRLKDYEFHVFNLVDSGKRFGSAAASTLCKIMDIPFVPILNENYRLPDTVEEMLEEANGVSVIAPVQREGLVIRSQNASISFKAVSPEYSTKEKIVMNFQKSLDTKGILCYNYSVS